MSIIFFGGLTIRCSPPGDVSTNGGEDNGRGDLTRARCSWQSGCGDGGRDGAARDRYRGDVWRLGQLALRLE